MTTYSQYLQLIVGRSAWEPSHTVRVVVCDECSAIVPFERQNKHSDYHNRMTDDAK